MTNMEWCVLNNIAAADLYCIRNNHKKPTMPENSCYIIKEVHGFVYSEFEDDATDFNKVILDWLATVFRKDCDVIFEGYKGYKERKEEEKKEAEKIDKKKVIDEMNEAVWNEFKNCFGGIE